MSTPIAWLNITQHKKRTAASIAGIAFSILLIFMQLGFLGATRKNATVVYDAMDFDLILCSNTFLTLTKPGNIDRTTMIKAQADEAVEHVSGILIGSTRLLEEESQIEKRSLTISINPDDPVFKDPELASIAGKLQERNSILLDRRTMPGFEKWTIGESRFVNDESLQIVGSYDLGVGVLASVSAIVSHETMSALQNNKVITEYSMALIKLKKGSDVKAVREQLQKRLPGTVFLREREELNKKERRFYVNTKPIGIMFKIGASVAFIVGAVILYQILSSEITNRMREYATMKAIGYPASFIYKIGIQQGIMYSILGFIPACILALIIYQTLSSISGFHLWMPIGRAVFVFILSLLMCMIAAVFALGKIRKADPADLF